jgi:hypothetical protein
MEATTMKAFRVISTTALLMFLGIAASANAQQGRHEEQGKPSQRSEQGKSEQHGQQGQQRQQSRPAQQSHAQQGQPAPQQQRDERAQQSKPGQQPHAQQSRPSQPKAAQLGPPAQQARQAGAASQQHSQQAQQTRPAQHPQGPYATSAQQTGRYVNRSGRIPENRFRSDFGRGHAFHIDRPYVAGGYSRFQYGGFWFGLYDPWPVGWYYTDNVYVDYINGGYFLYDSAHPGARISINVVM